jgi:electron transfer flavoprotein alpha/beta subunit
VGGRDQLSYTVNDFGSVRLEELLKLKDAGKVEEVAALTVGGADAAAALRTCLATGADRAIHVKDEALAGSDPFAVARAIHAAIASEGFSLILEDSRPMTTTTSGRWAFAGLIGPSRRPPSLLCWTPDASRRP